MNTAKIEYMPCTNPQGVAAPWGFILGLPSCVLTVKPLAYVVANYTCRDSQQKIEYFGHAFHLLPNYWAGVRRQQDYTIIRQSLQAAHFVESVLPRIL